MQVLVTGGAGYIGTHTVLNLLESGYEVVVIDNLVNSSIKAIERVEKLTNKKIAFYEGSILDSNLLERIFRENSISAVLHFAGLKAVGESVIKPIEYYLNNVTGTLVLMRAMQKAGVKNIIFSSSATVYGEPEKMPITEDFQTGQVTNPYGRSKFICEQMLIDIGKSTDLSVVILRYFNPVGADESGLIGEDPLGIPNNLVPYITQVAFGKLDKLKIFGNDYDTEDGTGVRDYIHIIDLALGHIKALETHFNDFGVHIYNLGTGRGYSVLEVVKAFEKVSGITIPYEFAPRREGDVAICYCDPSKAKNILNWQAKKTLYNMMQDSFNWQKQNPFGY